MTRTKLAHRAAPIVAALAAALLCACGDEPEPCDGVSCSGRGICFTDGVSAYCGCFAGFAPRGHECIEGLGCIFEHCTGHGECEEVGGVATGCRCDAGYRASPDGFFCFADDRVFDADLEAGPDADAP